MIAGLPGRRRHATATAETQSPLLSSADIAGLAAQALILAHPTRVREVHDHHAGDWASRWLGRGLDFEEARPYSPGDDIRDMDWRTTARTGRPYLKIYREERQPIWHLVVDRSATMRFGTRRRLKAAQAARVAALLAFAAVEKNGVVGASVWDATDHVLPAAHGRMAAWTLATTAARACPPQVDPARVNPTQVDPGADAGLRYHDRLVRLEAALPRGARLIILSDFSWLASEHQTMLARLGERFDGLAIQLIDPAERALPDVGLAQFHDIEAGRLRWLDTAQHQAGFRQAFAARQAQHADGFKRAGVQHCVIGCEVDDLAGLLSQYG